MKTKQVIIIRKDLKMRKGKMIAQGAHASMAVLLNEGKIRNQQDGNDEFVIKMNPEMKLWLEGKFTKICVSVNSEKELLDCYGAAQDAGLLTALIQDAGLTEFDGVPTYTAVAIGPAESSKIDEITSELPLL